MSSLLVRPAREDEWFPALEQLSISRNSFRSIELVRRGEPSISPCLLVAERGACLSGAILALPMPGSVALVWPPYSELPYQQGIADVLICSACTILKNRGWKIAQALIHSESMQCAASLTQNGFSHITQLVDFEANPCEIPPAPRPPARVWIRPAHLLSTEGIERTLAETYIGSRDCPEVNQVLSARDHLDACGLLKPHPPTLAWFAYLKREPVGLIIVKRGGGRSSWELAYVGVLPRFRGQGLGKQLIIRAAGMIRRRRARRLTLTVDSRNQHAQSIYKSLEFHETGRVELFLLAL